MSAPQLAERASTKPSVVRLNIEITLTWCQCNDGVALLGGAAEDFFFFSVSLWLKLLLLLLLLMPVEDVVVVKLIEKGEMPDKP